MKIGFIGLGKMGIPMAQRLIDAGYSLSVYNRSRSKAGPFASQGVQVAAEITSLVVFADVIILMVADDQATRDVVTGDRGILEAVSEGKIIVNMSTVSPGVSEEMSKLLRSKGTFYIDAPVSGSLKQAQEGSLVIMAGGEEQIFNKVKAVFNCLGKLALHVGDTGAGNTAKLAINALLSFHAQGLAEAVSFATAKGIAAADLLELINHSALGNVFMKIKGEAILQNNFAPVFALKHISKDLRLARNEGMKSPLSNAAFDTFADAEQHLGEEDIISILKAIEN